VVNVGHICFNLFLWPLLKGCKLRRPFTGKFRTLKDCKKIGWSFSQSFFYREGVSKNTEDLRLYKQYLIKNRNGDIPNLLLDYYGEICLFTLILRFILIFTGHCALWVLQIHSAVLNLCLSILTLYLRAIFFSRMAQQPLVEEGLLTIRSSWLHSDTPHSVELLWTSDPHDAEISTWQHTTLTRDRRPYIEWDSNPQSQKANVLDSAAPGIGIW
jgi:hypothetical protein